MSMIEPSPTTSPEEMRIARSWAERFLSDPGQLPIAWTYNGERISGIPAAWNPVARRRRLDANLLETVWEGADPQTGLNVQVECLEYRDYPVVEWTAWLKNRGETPTPILRDILAMEGVWEGSSPVLYHCNGDFYSEEGYTPRETALHDGSVLSFAPDGGRPCDRAFPYFRIRFEDGGLTLAVGWPGQWSAVFTGQEQGVRIQAGQEKTCLRLMPGESIRTPRMTLLFWTGDTDRAVNLWRRWYREHVLPRPDGRPMQPRLAVAGTDEGEEFTGATEANQIRYLERFKRLGFDYDVWWIDAGWYPCYNENRERRWTRTGTWEPDPERFPGGLKPVSDRAAANGAGLLVWFEPERVTPGSLLAQEHPEWLLKAGGSPDEGAAANSLLDLGNPRCRRWLTDHICRLIRDNGIGVYRQDFNFPPLSFWRSNDPEDRQGLHENLHVQGYLRFWEDLLAQSPGLWIDSCASGGRRNDLETMRRAVPLHYTDYGYGLPPVKLAFHHTLYAWLPYFKECTLAWDLNRPGEEMRFDTRIDPFAFHCGLAPMLFPTLDIRREDQDITPALRMIDLWRRAAPFLLEGDYYPLTPFSRSGERWVVWQFDRPETGEGLIQALRHADCPEETCTVYPKALRPDALWVWENPETHETREVSTTALSSDGFTFALPKRSAALWFYRIRI